MPVNKTELAKRIANFRQTIKDQKLALTPQKTEIFRVLALSTDHPNVTEIYKEVKKKFPTVSLATVYKNLKKFSTLGLILEIPIPGEATRYDARIDIHCHAVDTDLGRVYDLKIPLQMYLPKVIKGKNVKSVHLTYYL